MIASVKITTVGDSAAIVLPKEMLERLQVSEGDTLTVTETPTGLQLSVVDEKKRGQLEIAERIMGENRNMLAKLAE